MTIYRVFLSFPDVFEILQISVEREALRPNPKPLHILSSGLLDPRGPLARRPDPSDCVVIVASLFCLDLFPSFLTKHQNFRSISTSRS
jgi:hypothetical protein